MLLTSFNLLLLQYLLLIFDILYLIVDATVYVADIIQSCALEIFASGLTVHEHLDLFLGLVGYSILYTYYKLVWLVTLRLPALNNNLGNGSIWL